MFLEGAFKEQGTKNKEKNLNLSECQNTEILLNRKLVNRKCYILFLRR